MIEINGTYYAKDTIKAITKITNPWIDQPTFFSFSVKIIFGVDLSEEWLGFDTKENAEQSRKQLIEQLK
jgi:uncharacterized protein YecE (DUF72 family)